MRRQGLLQVSLKLIQLERFFGGFDLPRPQLVDIDGDGTPELFVQERSGELMLFRRERGEWVWQTDRFQDLDIGEWFRFADVDGDGRIDALEFSLSRTEAFVRADRDRDGRIDPAERGRVPRFTLFRF